MKCSLLLGVALVHPVAAVRSSDTTLLFSSPCAQATPDPANRWRFTLNHSQSQGVRHHSKYVLRLEPDCGGSDLATRVSVIPHISLEEPLQNSSVVITVEPDDTHQRYFVCHKVANESSCLAEVVLQYRAFRPRQLLTTLPLVKNSRRLLAVHLGESHPYLDALEWAICLIAVFFLVSLIKAVCVFIAAGQAVLEQDRLRDDQHTQERSKEEGCPINISSPLWESLDAWVNSLGFVVACVALVGGLMSILVSSNGPVWLIFLAMTWPATLGNLLLSIFWMSTCRLQLFSAALSRGICVRGRHPVSPRLILAGGCLSVLLLIALATSIQSLGSDSSEDTASGGQKIWPFVINPTLSLLSVFGFLYYRNLATHRTERPMSIEAMAQLMGEISTQEVDARGEVQLPQDQSAVGTWLARCLRSGSVPVISEGSFCELCRHGVDPVVAYRSKELHPQGPLFGLSDVAWQGKVVHQLSGYRIAIFNPPLALFFFLILTAASWCFAIVSMTTQPSLAGLEVSEYSLGRLYPDLRPWQTDYELVLDSFAHAFTFLETLSPDGTHKIHMGLPGGRNISTSRRSEMVTVVAHRRSFPVSVNMSVMGILGRTTNYNLFVVTDYKLFPGLQITPKDKGTVLLQRFSYSGEVDGSVFTLPGNTTEIEIVLYQELYSMAVPISRDEAKSKNASMLTVFSPVLEVPASSEECNRLCRNEARCMISRHSKRGCFFIWGPAQIAASAFSFVADPGTHRDDCDYLGVRLCARGDGEAPRCMDMERGAQGVLRGTLPFQYGRELRVHVSTYSNCKGLRKLVDDRMAEISFTRREVEPTAVLSMVPGVNTRLETKKLVDRKNHLEQVVTITLDRFVPTTPELVVYFAVLVSDNEVKLLVPWNARDLCTLDDQQEVPDTSLWERPCKQHWQAEQYSVCGGWRPSHIVRCRLEAWAPWIHKHFTLITKCWNGLCEKPTKIQVQTETEGEGHPAWWSLAASCSLDFRALEAAFADELLTPQVFMNASASCPSMQILMGNYTRNWSLIEYMKQALRRGPTMIERIGLLDSVAKSPFVENKTVALKEVGFYLCEDSREPCVLDETGFVEVGMENIVWYLPSPWQPGLVEHALDLYDDQEIHETVGLNAMRWAADEAQEELVKIIATYVKKRVKHVYLSGDDLNPALYAIKTKQAKVLRHILNVTTCCFKVANDFMDQTLWEFSIASGCDQCLVSLRRTCGVAAAATSLFFSSPSRTDIWAELGDVEKAFKELRKPLTSLGFVVVTPEALRRTLVKLSWLARRGSFKFLERVFFTAKQPMKLGIDAEVARLLCDLIRAQPHLSQLLLASEVDLPTSQTLIQCFRETGHGKESLELLPLPDDDNIIPLQVTQMFQRPRCTPEPNTMEVVSHIWLDDKPA